jgi:uncharacterized protein with LGFP repeats
MDWKVKPVGWEKRRLGVQIRHDAPRRFAHHSGISGYQNGGQNPVTVRQIIKVHWTGFRPPYRALIFTTA